MTGTSRGGFVPRVHRIMMDLIACVTLEVDGDPYRWLEMRSTVWETERGSNMQLITSRDATYDDDRSLFNSMVDKRPAVIAEVHVGTRRRGSARARARERYPVAVRAGGHSVAGMSSNDDGIVIDVRPMKNIEIDAAAMTARVGAGVTWSEFDRAGQRARARDNGWARSSTTGVAGFTLGGGSGWLERRYGLACDNLIAVDLVTADGREVTASEPGHPELFWGLHGGGGNFGVATSFTFRVHRVGPEVLAGLLLWPGDAGFSVGRAYRDFAFTAPDELGSGLVFITGPPEEFVPTHLQGATVAAIALLWAGEIADGRSRYPSAA